MSAARNIRQGGGRVYKPAPRKAELIAPKCYDNCQVFHTLEQTAAILSVSIAHVRELVGAGRLPSVSLSLGKKDYLRVPHTAIRKLIKGAG